MLRAMGYFFFFLVAAFFFGEAFLATADLAFLPPKTLSQPIAYF